MLLSKWVGLGLPGTLGIQRWRGKLGAGERREVIKGQGTPKEGNQK
jgi:hypothetical protein